LIVKAAYQIVFKSRISNSINTDEPMTGRKIAAVNQNLSITKIKALCKQIGCTQNDFMVVLMSNTFHEYFGKKGESYK
jgi:hypothetical protein